MQVCIISPVSHLKNFSVLGDMEMSLAPLLDHEEYVEYYKEQVKRGKFVIFDNGAFELEEKLGRGLGHSEVLELAKKIRPHEIICTDHLFEKDKTLDSTNKFVSYVRVAGNYVDGDVQLMAVPQGRTIDEWFQCYKAMLNMKEITTIGLSKVSVPQCFIGNREELGAITKGRILCTSEIVARGLEPDKYKKTVHLLGSDAWMGYEVRVQSQYKWIRSIDSSAPVHYGLNKKEMDVDTGRFNVMLTDKPDLENVKHDTAVHCRANEDKIYFNIAVVQKFAKGICESIKNY